MNTIHPPHEAFYIESMLRHTNSALDSVKIVGDWIELVVNDDMKALELSKDNLFESLQNIILQAGALSRFLWPAREGKKNIHKNRGASIRDSLDISDKSPLLDRKLRNGIEHFDENLDKYLLKDVIGHIIPLEVQAEQVQSEVPRHIFKGFYINPRVFILLGESFEMLPIIEEVEKIHNSLTLCEKNGLRF